MHRLIFLVLPVFVVLTFSVFVGTSGARKVTLLKRRR
jgi:hypothetical protein